MNDRPNKPSEDDTEVIHASCMALNGCCVVIRGASGSGKSALALELISRGAELVADDRTCLWVEAGRLWADAPERLSGLIEAREVGLLQVSPAGPHPVALIVDMDEVETDRLPEMRTDMILGCEIPRLRKSAMPHFPAAVATYLRGTRYA